MIGAPTAERRVVLLSAMIHGKTRGIMLGLLQRSAGEPAIRVWSSWPSCGVFRTFIHRYQPDMVIFTDDIASEPEWVETVSGSDAIAICLTPGPSDSRFHRIVVDDAQVGQNAGLHARKRGCQTGICIGADDRDHATRWRGFQDGFGRPARSLGSVMELDSLRHCIAEQPKPLAIFIANPIAIASVQHAVDALGLRCPEDVMLIAALDDADLAETSIPPLTTVAVGSIAIGQHIRQRLMAVDTSAFPRGAITQVDPGGITVRRSTDPFACDNQLIQHLVSHYRQNRTQQQSFISKVSRRTLERACRTALDMTPHELLQQVRLEHAQHLLRGTDSTLTTVAEACGLATTAQLHALFRYHVGITPSQWRRAANLPQVPDRAIH
jgi:AraC-like DNA-binding protein